MKQAIKAVKYRHGLPKTSAHPSMFTSNYAAQNIRVTKWESTQEAESCLFGTSMKKNLQEMTREAESSVPNMHFSLQARFNVKAGKHQVSDHLNLQISTPLPPRGSGNGHKAKSGNYNHLDEMSRNETLNY